MKKIIEIAKKIKIEDKIQLYGDYKAKIDDIDFYSKQKAKLILVSAISPTKHGEGKTTMTIGLTDALNALGKNTIGVLREPSLGPVLAMKGGACGGGKSTIEPMIDINLHFNGDIHAINAANNFIVSVLDNHLFYGNQLKIKEILIGRSVDLNDRAYRNLLIENKIYQRVDKGYIAVASEIMAIFCLAENLSDLKSRLAKMIIAIDQDNNPLGLTDFKILDAVVILLKDAFKVNLVQSQEHSPFIVHGGPFANIAHGCNSVKATKTALTLADYVVTEAGFALDLGGEKFLDIKCRYANLRCDLVVLVLSIKALKSLGAFENDFYNLRKHISTLKSFNTNFILCLNLFDGDAIEDIAAVQEFARINNYSLELSTAFKDGGSIGSKDLAEQVIEKIASTENKIEYLYDLDDSFEQKLTKLVTKVYDCQSFTLNEQAKNKLELYRTWGLDKLAICVAKSPLYLCGKAVNDGNFEVTDLYLANGAGFIVVSCGSVLKMPGLNQEFNAQKMTISDDGIIKGIF